MSQDIISIVEVEAMADIIRTRAIKVIIISIIKAQEKESNTKNPLKISILGIKNQEETEIDLDLEARAMTQEEKNISRRSLALEEVDQAQDQWKWIVAIL